MSPTRTGCLKMNSFTATVAIRPLAWRAAITPPARSTWAMTQPPKMSPLALLSAGMGITLSTSSLSTGKGGPEGRVSADMGTITSNRPTWIVPDAPFRRTYFLRRVAHRHGPRADPHPYRLGHAQAPVSLPVGIQVAGHGRAGLHGRRQARQCRRAVV